MWVMTRRKRRAPSGSGSTLPASSLGRNETGKPHASALRDGISVRITWFAVLMLAVTAQAADWPRLGGPDASWISPETNLARNWPVDGPRVMWSVEVLSLIHI